MARQVLKAQPGGWWLVSRRTRAKSMRSNSLGNDLRQSRWRPGMRGNGFRTHYQYPRKSGGRYRISQRFACPIPDPNFKNSEIPLSISFNADSTAVFADGFNPIVGSVAISANCIKSIAANSDVTIASSANSANPLAGSIATIASCDNSFATLPNTNPQSQQPSFKDSLIKKPTQETSPNQALGNYNNNSTSPKITCYNMNSEQYKRDPMLNGRSKLPLPPDPFKVQWKNRCFNCLLRGHDSSTCPSQQPVCPCCLLSGHRYKICPKYIKMAENKIDPLMLRGNIGDELIPVDRPHSLSAFVPQSSDSIRDIRDLSKAVVIDARLKHGNHTATAMQAIAMAISGVSKPFSLIKFTAHSYLLLLPEGMDREVFITSCAPAFEDLGLVLYPWSPRLGAVPFSYPFKVWLDIFKLPMHAWDKHHILPLLSRVGLVLSHTSFSKIWDAEYFRVHMAVPCLNDIPKHLELTIKGLSYELDVSIAAWIEERFEVKPPIDPTPSVLYFQEVQRRLHAKSLIPTLGVPNTDKGKEPTVQASKMVAVGFDLAFAMWEKLDICEEKANLEETLKLSPYWEIKLKEKLLSEMHINENSKACKEGIKSVPSHSQPISSLQIPEHNISSPVTQLNGSHSLKPSKKGTTSSLEKCKMLELNQFNPERPQLNLADIPDTGTGLAKLPATVNNSVNSSNTGPILVASLEGRDVEDIDQLQHGAVANKAIPCCSTLIPPQHTISDPSQHIGSSPLDQQIDALILEGRKSAEKAQAACEVREKKNPVPVRRRKGKQPLNMENAAKPLPRRSSRVAKPSSSLKDYLTLSKQKRKISKDDGNGNSNKKIVSAIKEAGLARCLDFDNVATVPLSQEETSAIAKFCGILQPLEAVQNSVQSTAPQETAPLNVSGQIILAPINPLSPAIEDDDVLSGLDSYESLGFEDLDDEVSN